MSQGCQDPRTMEATKHAALGSLSYPTWLGVHRMVREVWYFRPQHIPPSHGGSRMGKLLGSHCPPGVPKQQGQGSATSPPGS